MLLYTREQPIAFFALQLCLLIVFNVQLEVCISLIVGENICFILGIVKSIRIKSAKTLVNVKYIIRLIYRIGISHIINLANCYFQEVAAEQVLCY